MRQKQQLSFNPKFRITGRIDRTIKGIKKQYIKDFLYNYAKQLINYGYESGYKKLSNYITRHFRNMNLEIVDVALSKEEQHLHDRLMISHSPHSWSLRSPYNNSIICKFPTHYVEKLISFYNEFAKKMRRSSTIKVKPFENLNAENTPLLLAYEIFPKGKRIFIPRVSLCLKTYFITIWIYAEQDPPTMFVVEPGIDFFLPLDMKDPKETEYQADITIIKITFNTRGLSYYRGKSFRGKHKKNIDRVLAKNFSPPDEISQVAKISLNSWEFEQGREGDLTLYYKIASDKVWHLDIENILGLVDLTLKGF